MLDPLLVVKDIHTEIASRAQGKFNSEIKGYIFSSGAIVWENGDRVHLSLIEHDNRIQLQFIKAVPEEKGNGSYVLDKIKAYARAKNLPIVATEVDNPDYFTYQGFTPEENWDEETTGESIPSHWWYP